MDILLIPIIIVFIVILIRHIVEERNRTTRQNKFLKDMDNFDNKNKK